jgi:beta-glucanase (GH16 family)
VNKSNVAGWHTYAAEWRQGVVTYFYDGEQVGRITQGITSAPMYLVLNLGVSSTVSGPVTLPAEMLVDYVKVTT